MVVVGSGPAGSTAALFLSRRMRDVLLLEAGDEEEARGVTARVRGFTLLRRRRELQAKKDLSFHDDTRATVYEALAPGGLSNHWSGAVPRFSPDDFEDGRRAGTEFTWPLGYDELVPFYERVEPLLRIAGSGRSVPQLPAGRVEHARELGADWSAVDEAAHEDGRSVVAMPYTYGAESTVTPSGNVFNAFVRLVKPELGAGRLRVKYGARVLALEWSPSERRVVALLVKTPRSLTPERVPCRAVVLAAGAVNTAHILLASQHADFPNGLSNTHDVLGRYLHDHPVAKLVVDLTSTVSAHPASYLTRSTLDRSPPLFAAGCMQWAGASNRVQSLLRGKPGRASWLGFTVFGTMAPSRDDWVELDPTRRDADGAARLSIRLRQQPEAIRALEVARDALMAALTKAGWQPATRVWKVEDAGASVHYGGTCRLHDSPEFGMLDRHHRLHSCPNVIVVDSSSFTTTPEKNPVLTAMTLSARASERLAEELASGDR